MSFFTFNRNVSMQAGQYSLQQQSSPSAQTVVTEKSDSALNVGGRKRSLPPGEAISARRSGPIPYRIEQSPKRVEVQPQHSYEAPRREPPPDFLDALAKDETEEERRVREEIENTQRKLLWLQEQQVCIYVTLIALDANISCMKICLFEAVAVAWFLNVH